MEREEAMMAALQLQHDVSLITSNLQVLGQFVTSLSHMSSEMRLAFGKEVFPSDAVQAVSPAPRVHCTQYGCNGFVAITGWPGRSRAIAGLIL